MLYPEEFNEYSQKIVEEYSNLEKTLIALGSIALVKIIMDRVFDTNSVKSNLSLDTYTEINKTTNRAMNKTNDVITNANIMSLQREIEMYRKANRQILPNMNAVDKQIINAIVDNTQIQLKNYTNSMGFQGKSAQTFYNEVLDTAYLQTLTGTLSYQDAITQAIKRMSDRGLTVVEYPSGVTRNVSTAVRTAVMTGLSQTTAKVTERNIKDLQVELVEVSAHAGARPQHQEWQGEVYYWAENTSIPNYYDYPDFISSTEYGEATGLCGINCRHSFFPFFRDISEPAYTEEDIKNIDPEPFEFEGKIYDAYKATQRQRKMETIIRSLNREMVGYNAAGDDFKSDYNAILRQRDEWIEKYVLFSKKADIPEQRWRFD